MDTKTVSKIAWNPSIDDRMNQSNAAMAQSKQNHDDPEVQPNQSNDVSVRQDEINGILVQRKEMNLFDLNDECLGYIMKYLRYKDMVVFARSSRRAKSIAKTHIHRLFVMNLLRPLQRIENDLQYIIRTLRR